MLTPNDIRNVLFTKIMGGYKTSEVNEFIDECADTVEALIKEKTAAVEALNREKQDLQKKLEVLADKLVEYRNDEDNIRTALLSAQRLGDATLREANHKASLIMDDAKISAIPQIKADCPDASLIHEAAIGKIAGDQIIKLMTLGLTAAEAEEQIIEGFLK